MALPFHVTYERFEQFLWFSFAFIFIPLILLVAVLLLIGWGLVKLALIPARALWNATSTDGESSVSAQLREREEYLKKLRAERAKGKN